MTADLDHVVVGKRRHVMAFVILVLLATAYWLWFGTTARSIIEDEGISILMAEGILEHGYPRLPSGLIYHRAYLPGYLLAASIGALGRVDLAIMLPSLLMALLSLLLTYRFGRDILRQPLVGLLAGASLVALSNQTFYATSARMYMSLQFFTLLSLYAGWRGFVQAQRRYEWLTLFAVAGAILSHQQGGALLVSLPISILVMRRVAGLPLALGWRRGTAGLFALMALFWFASVYQPRDVIQRVIAHSGVDPEFVGFNLNLDIWWRHVLALESLIPFVAVLGPLIALGCFAVLRSSGSPVRNGFAYALMHFILFSLALFTNVLTYAPRMWVAILPLCLLVSISAIVHANDWLRDSGALRVGVFGATIAIAVCVALLTEDPLARISQGYGWPCVRTRCNGRAASEYRAFGARLSEQDRVIATNPWVASYYLGRVDGVFRQRRVGGAYTAFDASTDEYFGIEIIDDLAGLEALWQSPRRVWIIADGKLRRYSGPRLRTALRRKFELVHQSPVLRIFSNRSQEMRPRPESAANGAAHKSSDGVVPQASDSHER